MNEKWRVITPLLSGGMFLFLNDMYFHEDIPIVKDYLKRLFRGESCGNFPDDLNLDIQINYQQAKASDLLNEGPLLCPDGMTPVVQLWPAVV